jgi:hypothetical protein
MTIWRLIIIVLVLGVGCKLTRKSDLSKSYSLEPYFYSVRNDSFISLNSSSQLEVFKDSGNYGSSTLKFKDCYFSIDLFDSTFNLFEQQSRIRYPAKNNISVKICDSINVYLSNYYLSHFYTNDSNKYTKLLINYSRENFLEETIIIYFDSEDFIICINDWRSNTYFIPNSNHSFYSKFVKIRGNTHFQILKVPPTPGHGTTNEPPKLKK